MRHAANSNLIATFDWLGRSMARGLTSVTVVVAMASGCPQQECVAYNDCPAGEYCDENYTCLAVPGERRGSTVGVGGGGDGGTTSDVEIAIQTQFPIPWMMRDPRPNTNRVLFPRYAAGQFDELRSFDLTTGTIATSNEIELQTLGPPSGPCELDNVYFETAGPDFDTDETWLLCRQGTSVRIYYDDAFEQPGLGEPGSAHVSIPLTIPGNQTNDENRRFVFERGGTSVTSIRLNKDNDSIQVARLRDNITASLSAVTQAWQLASINTGDTVLVLDRGADKPRLVPLMRAPGTTEWLPSEFGLPAADLPKETHAVVLIGTVDPTGQGNPGVPNIMAIEPETGRLAFYFYGASVTNGEPTYLNQTLFETSENYRAIAPDPEQRLLLATAPGGGTLYAHQASSRVWLLPHTPNGENAVRIFTFANGFHPSGIIPIGGLSAWVSVPSQIQLFKVTLGVDN